MKEYTVEVAEVHWTSYKVKAETPEEAREKVFESGEMIDGSTEFSHLLDVDKKVYDDSGQLVLD